jgi:hypothetical protein
VTPRIPENILAWLVDWSLVSMGNTIPPRDPNGDDDEDEEEEGDEDSQDELPIVREPEPDE